VNIKTKDHIVPDRQQGGRRAARWVDDGCSRRALCARCSMMKIVQYRFKAFRRAFGRNPLPHEPLFFCARADSPRLATKSQIIRQLEEAAQATMVKLPPVLELLGLA
jgi:hypothetical protein